MIAILTNDSRAGTHKEQLALIGGEPERTYVIEDVRDYLKDIIRDGDVVAVSHPRIFGPKTLTERAIEVIYKAGAVIRGYSDPFAFMEAHRVSKWGKGTKRQKVGKPPEIVFSEDDKREILRMWWTPRIAANPRGHAVSEVVAFASGCAGRKVEVHNVKYLAKQAVGHVRRKGVVWANVFNLTKEGGE